MRITTRLRAIRDRLVLSRAEEAMVFFVLAVIAAGLLLRAWDRWMAPSPAAVPAEFARMDSVFRARAAAVTLPTVLFDSTIRAGAKPVPPPEGIDINRDPVSVLASLPGVGPRTAERIAAFRVRTPFRVPEDLMRVHGIGPRRFARMRAYLRVE